MDTYSSLFPIAGYMFYLFSGQLYVKGKLFKTKRMYNREKLRKQFDMEETPEVTGLKDNQERFLPIPSGLHI